jgi:hypothetical protein
MKIHVDNLSASKAGDYYQVMFEKEEDSDKAYFLIEQQFEFPFGDECYIESHSEEYTGQFKVMRAELRKSRFFMQLKRQEVTEVVVTFNTSDLNYKEVKRVLGIMLPGLIILD